MQAGDEVKRRVAVACQSHEDLIRIKQRLTAHFGKRHKCGAEAFNLFNIIII